MSRCVISVVAAVIASINGAAHAQSLFGGSQGRETGGFWFPGDHPDRAAVIMPGGGGSRDVSDRFAFAPLQTEDSLLNPAPPAQTTGTADTDSARNERWSSFLPLMGEKAEEHGYELPLPFGVGVYGFWGRRDYEIRSLELSFNGSPPIDVGSPEAIDVTGGANNVSLRADMFLLPFLNLYVLGGHTGADYTTTVTVPDPRPGQGDLRFEIPVDVNGTTLGGGITLAGGYGNFFLAGDANYTWTDLDISDSYLNALIASLRTGWQGKLTDDVHGAFYTGVTYWDTASTVTGSVGVEGLTVDFKVEQGPTQPWNFTLGASAFFKKHWQANAEVGFHEDVLILIGGLQYRF